MNKSNLPIDIRQLKSEIESLNNFVKNKMDLDFSSKYSLREKFKLVKKLKNDSEEIHWTSLLKITLLGGAVINLISALFNMSTSSLLLSGAGFGLVFLVSKLIDLSRFETNKNTILEEEKKISAQKLEISTDEVISLSLHLNENEKEKFVKMVEKTGNATIEDVNIILSEKVKLYDKVSPGEEKRLKTEEFKKAIYQTSDM